MHWIFYHWISISYRLQSSDDEDYDPDQDELSNEDEEPHSDDDAVGPSARKRPKIDPESEVHDSDSNSD